MFTRMARIDELHRHAPRIEFLERAFDMFEATTTDALLSALDRTHASMEDADVADKDRVREWCRTHAVTCAFVTKVACPSPGQSVGDDVLVALVVSPFFHLLLDAMPETTIPGVSNTVVQWCIFFVGWSAFSADDIISTPLFDTYTDLRARRIYTALRSMDPPSANDSDLWRKGHEIVAFVVLLAHSENQVCRVPDLRTHFDTLLKLGWRGLLDMAPRGRDEFNRWVATRPPQFVVLLRQLVLLQAASYDSTVNWFYLLDFPLLRIIAEQLWVEFREDLEAPTRTIPRGAFSSHLQLL